MWIAVSFRLSRKSKNDANKTTCFAEANFTLDNCKKTAKSRDSPETAIWPDLSYAHKDLRGKNFYRADLSDVNFTGSDLRGVNFRHANLEGANFVGAKLNGADFRFATLNKANLTKVKMHKGRFDAADIKRASLKKAKFGSKVSIRGADFSKSHLRKADLSGVDARGIEPRNFRGENFVRRTRFYRADLTSAKLIGIRAHGAFFENSILVNADLTDASAARARFTDANMYNTTLDGFSAWHGLCPDGILDWNARAPYTCSLERIKATPYYGAHLTDLN